MIFQIVHTHKVNELGVHRSIRMEFLNSADAWEAFTLLDDTFPTENNGRFYLDYKDPEQNAIVFPQ